MDYLFVLICALTGLLLVPIGLLASRMIAPRRPGGVKQTPYECGEKTIGSTWVQFNIGYYLFALLFLVFDVEAAFLFPWATIFRELGVIGLIEVDVFVFVLILGLVYVWKKGLLEWV